MAIRIPHFGRSEVDKVVMEWLSRHGIPSESVASYSVNKDARKSTITLTMHFDDVPALEVLADEKDVNNGED